MTVTVLGPQRRPTVQPVPPGTVAATVTAGWREREADDAELDGLLGGSTVNLRLHTRWLTVLDADPELADAELNHRAVLEELQDLYALQVGNAEQAAVAIRRSSTRPRTRAAALADSEEALRLLDARHLARVTEVRADFEAAWRPGERDAVAQQRAQVAAVLEDTSLLVVTGGHVGVLLHVLGLFAVTPPADVVAWSAGAMALTDRVVLFTDGRAEAYAPGLGVVNDTVLLPHARRRLPMDDPARLGALARRFAPARCVVLDDGVRGLDRGRVVGADGRVA
ncbi:MAG TPA: hypothetical protein VGP36_07100 [Mycobacteriales bacterium]|jgi:hypothetical protein|nr:hypothetical protein [Mycobacteriales bacterium]